MNFIFCTPAYYSIFKSNQQMHKLIDHFINHAHLCFGKQVTSISLCICLKISHESKVTMYWDKQIRTDGIIPNNKPDIIVRYSEKETS
jgi:hypothetical protein